MSALNTVTSDGSKSATGSSGLTGPYNDELSLVSGKRKQAESEDDEINTMKDQHKHQKSDSSSVACRNAEAGTQLSRSVNNLSAAMSKPIVTTEDLTHVDEIICILQDKTLLPPDLKGKLFHLASSALSCILEGILEDAGITIPDDY
ncbi:hypothetical protein B0H10DRAFT_2223595 [Mycena sp. CBHHK59/15]|nr:hypothetical protein B0H10DRAFT_2223595 [Mycena sp. CBHHK59/15]